VNPSDRVDRAIVIVSGGAAVSPFTTPYEACREGLAAGNTDTFLRQGLLDAGFSVFTSPARIGAGEVTQDTGWGGFSNGPAPLPAEMTVNAVGDIDEAGRALAQFVGHLYATYGAAEIDLVAHSMGGLFSRAAIRELRDSGSPVVIRTLTTLGTPWEGSYVGDYAVGDLTLAECNGDPFCEDALTKFAALVADVSEGAGEQVASSYLTGPDGWNERQAGVLTGIPVVLIGGDHLNVPGDESVWPNDGLVPLRSALAKRVTSRVLPHAERFVFSDVHSIYFSHKLELPWERALTWDPDVLATVIRAIERPGACGESDVPPRDEDRRSHDGGR
jgi:pimeloyl-ACP methyl ester carboxylesterase